METSIVTSKGQVVIPSKLRRKYGIKNGTRIHFYEVNGEIRIVPVTPELIDKNIGLLGTKGKLMRALLEDKKREREL
ncbi:MAG: AbrB/MazE/SpoVT family DNA-binding domain-containing protein [Candidatus Brocadiaceae bacterium]|uniref:AbrB/MazE/SpoVT family DNA-binding domain-containing protein n=1 Tax=Candidatus Wunengus sp. YC61 TaxID=3367698 RepID=UPI0027161DBA|nr:AbrB/MazE/SpoVT family DNA-binding domain-containing protein [Candidatus Brocadiaceae bacterium]